MTTSKKITHTIKLNDARRMSGTVSEKRVSVSKTYRACLVITHTERSVEIANAAIAALTVERAALVAQLADAVAIWGSVEVAAAEGRKIADAWYAAVRAVADRLYAEAKKNGQEFRMGVQNEAEAEAEAAGGVRPYARGTVFDVEHITSKLRWLDSNLADAKSIKLGVQGVASWHGSVDLAHKAVNSHAWAMKLGHSITVRTDITIDEKVVTPRAKK